MDPFSSLVRLFPMNNMHSSNPSTMMSTSTRASMLLLRCFCDAVCVLSASENISSLSLPARALQAKQRESACDGDLSTRGACWWSHINARLKTWLHRGQTGRSLGALLSLSLIIYNRIHARRERFCVDAAARWLRRTSKHLDANAGPTNKLLCLFLHKVN